MIMGHIGFGEKVDRFIHAFHMPMFFFISGFFYRRKEVSFIEEIKYKAKSMLIPYFFFGIFHYIVYILKDGFAIGPLLHLLTINTDGLPIAGALWFLTALFFTDSVYFMLDRHNCKWVIVPLILIGSFADQLLPYPLPWALSASFVGLGLYWCGSKTRQHEKKLGYLLNMTLWCILVIGPITTVSIFLNGYINMRTGTYAIVPLFWINALLSIFVGISMSKYVVKLKVIKHLLVGVGENSIVYLCLNQLVILVCTKILRYTFFDGVISKLFILALSLAGLYICEMLFTKTRMKILIGK